MGSFHGFRNVVARLGEGALFRQIAATFQGDWMESVEVVARDGVRACRPNLGRSGGSGDPVPSRLQPVPSVMDAAGEAPELAGCRMVTMDLRGHGASENLQPPRSYSDDTLWADDVAAVMDATGLQKPVVVAWSYAGRVITDYVRHRGTERAAGINLLDASDRLKTRDAGCRPQAFVAMTNDDLVTNIEHNEFPALLFRRAALARDFQAMLAFNMVIPPAVREADPRAHAQRRRHAAEDRRPGAGDARRKRPADPAVHGPLRCGADPERDTVDVRRRRAFALLRRMRPATTGSC